ncbi:hypothetical protein BLA29_008046 [Euroglyphus maynei]|uniref:Pseudouridine synthase RsuA/RluA-like domain-containing protein n=1 Tax=Euroglyphus maynei TaxID=6958 RepID=A0A1Y3BQP1_EURMA|nr:hypothetical protein BLA29_008046 [Euroglyphus maynei]
MIINHSCHYSPWNLIKYFTFRRNTLAMNTAVKRKTVDKDDDNDEIENNTKTKPDLPPAKKSRMNKVDLPKESLDVSDYYIDNGNRKVYPYHYTYHSYCKGRWFGKTLGELFADEFRALTPEIIGSKIEKGHLKVNGQPVPLNYQLNYNDFITHRIHRHEFPVLAAPIPIIHSDDDLLVIDKPPSIPVHACGKFRFNSIISILEKENNIKDLHLLHRLDRLTSGIMIMAKTKARAQKLHEQMRNREMHKEYLCRVDGHFPE